MLSITNGAPKPMVDVNGKPFIQSVLDNLSGFDVTLVCSDLNYEYFKDLGVDVFNEGEPSGTCLLYTSPSPRDVEESRMPSSA